MRRAYLILGGWLALAGCGGETSNDASAGAAGAGQGGSAGSSSGTSLPCDVSAILRNSCQNCHGTETAFGAPMSLVTYADLQAPAVTDASRKVYELVNERIRDDAHPMPQAPYTRLTDEQLAVFAAWTSAGAPASNEKCSDGNAGAAGSAGSVTSASCTPNLSLKPTSAWNMPADRPDIYVCYGVDIQAGDIQAVTGFVPRVDNEKIVHHILLFQSDTPTPTDPAACENAAVSLQNKLLYGWAPGGVALEMPKGVGMPLDETTHYFLQIHYNNIQGLEGETDSSGIDLCTTTEMTDYDADMIAFGTMQFNLPAHQETTYTCNYTWPASAGEVNVVAAFPHMHQLGTAISTVVNPGTDDTDLGKYDPWDFNNQPFLPISATLKPGDQIQTTCAWNNTTNSLVRFGEYTEDEMCYSFTMYYPRATSLPFWATPAFKSECF
ncbi:MAG: peptidylglycine alpha-amidating monooxygenase [Polyangiaceae bacterium]